MNLILVNADGPEKRVALLENEQLVELHIERVKEQGITGNVYRGRVLRVLPGMQAAFVDIGVGRAAFLYVADVGGEEGEAGELYLSDRDEPGESCDDVPREEISRAMRAAPIQERIHEGQELLVQVAREPIGGKGARVTSLTLTAHRATLRSCDSPRAHRH